MPFFLLSAVLLLLAVLLWYSQAAAKTAPPPAVPDSPPPAVEPQTLDKLCGVVERLREVMDHPDLGGPGFLTLRFPPQTGGAVVTAQYPNIREALYRRIIRRELSRETLLAEGFPAGLLDLSPDFEAESGGVVLLTVELRDIDGALTRSMASLRERQELLRVLTERLRERLPAFYVRSVGGELLLTPVREAVEV